MKNRSIDWDDVRARLRASEVALAEALNENPARVEAVYRLRAAQLAKPQAADERPTNTLAVMLFNLQQECYALELTELAEVLPFGSCTTVPGASSCFLGVINLRGEIRPVVDLALLVVGKSSDRTNSGFILMLRRPGREIGLKVDQVTGIRHLPANLDQAEPGTYTKGMTSEGILLVDVEKVLTGVFSGEDLLIS
jgi:purine-binding chemotaxis protein CheW